MQWTKIYIGECWASGVSHCIPSFLRIGPETKSGVEFAQGQGSGGCHVFLQDERYTSNACGRCGGVSDSLGGKEVFVKQERVCVFV